MRFDDADDAANAALSLILDSVDTDHKTEVARVISARSIVTPGNYIVDVASHGLLKFSQAVARKYWSSAFVRARAHDPNEFELHR